MAGPFAHAQEDAWAGRGVPPQAVALRAGIGGAGAERRNRKRLCGAGLRVQPQPLPSALLSALGAPITRGSHGGSGEVSLCLQL